MGRRELHVPYLQLTIENKQYFIETDIRKMSCASGPVEWMQKNFPFHCELKVVCSFQVGLAAEKNKAASHPTTSNPTHPNPSQML